MDIPHITRRSLIASAVTGGAAALLVQPASLLEKANAAANPACDPHSSVDPYGVHQAGITTSAPEHLQLAAFDLVPGTTRPQLVELLQAWQGAIGLLTRGLPLPDAGSPLISCHYIDEFAEAHAKDLLVRQWLDAAVPAAGVGVAIDRAMLGRIADARDGAPFDAASLTEDYELGQHVHALGGRGRLVWVLADGQPVATREHFPASFDAAVRQKARWLTGIALAGWDRIGWRGGLVNRWMLLRDRKAPLMALLTLAAYGIALLFGIDSLLRLALPAAARLPPVAGDVTRALLWLNWTLLCWRLLVRALFTLRVHGLSQAILTPPRALVGNFINAMAALRALSRYAQAVRTGRRLAWDKTIHRFPGFSP